MWSSTRTFFALGAAAGTLIVVRIAFFLTGAEFTPLGPVADLVEGTVLAVLVLVSGSMARALAEARREQALLRDQVDHLTGQVQMLQARDRAPSHQVEAVVSRQFSDWDLTPAEADVAGLMLKGMSLKEIGLARGTSEVTIRRQAARIYRKSGLAGRAELSAYFLDSLFPVMPHSAAE